MIRNVIRRMARMCPAAWEFLIRSLQLSCFLLLCALALLHKSESAVGFLSKQSAAFQESAQVALLLGAIIPVCLEDLIGSDEKTPPGSSRR